MNISVNMLINYSTLAFTILLASTSCHDGPHIYTVAGPFEHGEGPVWDPRSNLLYFVDIHEGRLHSYNPNNCQLNSIQFPGDLSVVVPVKNDEHLLVIGLNRSIVALEWEATQSRKYKTRILGEVAMDKPTSRFNDGKADKGGRLWMGTMGLEINGTLTPNEGSLFRVQPPLDGVIKPEVVISPVNISNGLTWNRKNNIFYYIDTPTLQIRQYDYDEKTGGISNPKVAFDFQKDQDRVTGYPDGMTADSSDHLWVALYNGGCVVRINPATRSLTTVVPIPSQRVTSVMFGGDLLDVLYVTTSRYGLSVDERKRQPGAGYLYAVEGLSVEGVEAFQTSVIEELE